jgi:hypothetical protein
MKVQECFELWQKILIVTSKFLHLASMTRRRGALAAWAEQDREQLPVSFLQTKIARNFCSQQVPSSSGGLQPRLAVEFIPAMAKSTPTPRNGTWSWLPQAHLGSGLAPKPNWPPKRVLGRAAARLSGLLRAHFTRSCGGCLHLGTSPRRRGDSGYRLDSASTSFRRLASKLCRVDSLAAGHLR